MRIIGFKKDKVSISKNKIKYIQSLKMKKKRDQFGVFVAEGEKCIENLINNSRCQYLAGIPEVINRFKNVHSIEEIVDATPEELQRASHFKTPSSIIGVFYQENHTIDSTTLNSGLHLVLDEIQDPGNMGTIIRLADWFGIESIICSHNTVDIYNPKTVQATMGAITRVPVVYTDLHDFLQQNSQLPVYGTFLEGNNIYEENLSKDGFIVMGNEGKGISREIEEFVTNKLLIPSFATDNSRPESLNVAVATAIVCSEFRRS